MKRCCFCKELKPLSHFHKASKSSDGLRSRCKECIGKKKPEPKEGHKICTCCGEEKPFSEFGPDKKGKHGLTSQCHSCKRKKSYAYWNENRDEMNQKQKESYWSSLEESREKAKERTRRYRLKNLPFDSWDEYAKHTKQESEYKQKCRTYRKNKDRLEEVSRASYSFGDEEFFNFFMDEARHLSKLRYELTGVKYHVDHIIPLKAGKSKVTAQKACGLHTPANVQVISEKSNLVKGARKWPDMWEKDY